MEDEKLQNAQFDFSGQWVPSLNPLKIGSENFSQLDNMSYIDNGVEMCLGYAALNENSLADENPAYPKGRSGMQIQTPYSSLSPSFNVIELWNDGETAASIRVNRSTGDTDDLTDFDDGPFYTPSALGGRFSRFPSGIGYANGVESCIWNGDYMRCAAFFKVTAAPTGLDLTGAIDYTQEVNNNLEDGNNPTVSKFIIGTTRPAEKFSFYFETPNATTSTLTVKKFTASGWTTHATVQDNTATGGVSMKLDLDTGGYGYVKLLTPAITTHKQAVVEETRLYYYYFELSAGSVQINQVLIGAPFQEMVDIWDGIYRDCIGAIGERSNIYENWTQEVNTISSAEYPIAAKFGGLTSTDMIYLCCQERACAVRLNFIAGLANATAATITLKYYTGAAWADPSITYDGTALGGASFGQTGIISWTPPTAASEKPRTISGTTGYWYRITFSATLTDGTDHDGTSVDQIQFIPAEKQVYPYKFPFEFQGRAMLCNFEAGSEENRVDYSMKNAPDVWNGEDSSDLGKSLYFGGYEKLMAASSIYNRFGSSIYEIALFLKTNETYLLNGTGPEDFRIFKISTNYGCPAPNTVATAEVAYSMSEDLQRNICIWLSYTGPVVFDGAVIKPIKGVEIYFDDRQSTCVNYDAIDKAYGAFDPHRQEYHLLLPCGADQETINTWLVFDVQRQRWYRRVVDGAAAYPQMIFPVKNASGVCYLFGMVDTGYLMRLNTGTSWNGVDMVHRLKTAAITPTGSIWDECRVRKFKLMHEVPDFDESTDEIDVGVKCYADGSDTEPTYIFETFTISEQSISQAIIFEFDGGGTFYFNSGEQFTVGKSGKRNYYDEKKSCNIKGLSFVFEFSQTSNDFSYLGNFGKRMLGWGFQWIRERERP